MHQPLLRDLAEGILASEGLESFLTVTMPEGARTLAKITVSGLSRFRSGMGKTLPYTNDGEVYRFLGKVEEEQMHAPDIEAPKCAIDTPGSPSQRGGGEIQRVAG